MTTYAAILDRLTRMNDTRYRSDPEREQTMREETTAALIDLLEKLGAQSAEVRLRAALADLVGGMRTLKLADKLPGPVSRAEAVLNETA